MPFFTGLSVGGGYQFATIGTVTGSSANGSFTDANNFVWQYWRFTGNGSVVCDTAGYVDLLVIGGGGGGQNSNPNGAIVGGGAGGTRFGIFWLPAATHTVTIGGGGGTAGAGVKSSFGNILMSGGGMAGWASTGINAGNSPKGGGGSGGGAAQGPTGNRVGSGAGGDVYGTNAYDGITFNYDGTLRTFGVGGSSPAAGTANTGNSGYDNNGGGSGTIFMKVRIA